MEQTGVHKKKKKWPVQPIPNSIFHVDIFHVQSTLKY